MLLNQDEPLHKKIEKSMKKITPDQDPVEFLEISFKFFLTEMFVVAMDEKMVPQNRLSADHYKIVSRFLINEFMKAEDIPDKCKFSIRKYEQLRDETMQGIANTTKNNKGKNTAQVRTVLDFDAKEHFRKIRKTQSGIILPPGVKI